MAALTNGFSPGASSTRFLRPRPPPQQVFASFFHLVLRFQPRELGLPQAAWGYLSGSVPSLGTVLLTTGALGLMEAEVPLSPQESSHKMVTFINRPSTASQAGYRPLHGSSCRRGEEGTPEVCHKGAYSPATPGPSRPRDPGRDGARMGPGDVSTVLARPSGLAFVLPFYPPVLTASLSSVPAHSRSFLRHQHIQFSSLLL